MRNSLRRGAVICSTIALVAGFSGTAAAQEPTPPGEGSHAEATAAEVNLGGEEGLTVSVGDTSATQDGTDQATGWAARIMEDQGIGGAVDATNEDGGALIDTDDVNEGSEMGRLAVLPWNASATDSESAAAAAALIVRIDNPSDGSEGIYLEALGSESNATEGAADARSDGLILRLGGDQLVVNVLHSEASSDGSSMAYVLGVNDEHIITSEDTGEQCALEVPDVVALTCVTAQAISSGALANVLHGEIGPGGDLGGIDLIGAGSATAPEAAQVEPTTIDDEARSALPEALATTGGSLSLAAVALLLIGLGAWAASRRRADDELFAGSVT